MKKYITSLLFLLSIAGYSQTQITGTVLDASTNEPLIGANIYLPDLPKGTTTNEEGKYLFEQIPYGQFIIEVSYLGYKSILKKVVCETPSLQLNLSLSPSSFITEEVVIIGGQPTAQHENAIQIVGLKAAELHGRGEVTFMRTLSKIPGVDIITKGNAVATPVIRGLSTSNILVLQNGIRTESFQFSENHPFMIDEFGVEKVEVIKGPASLLYGSDAVGGAINVISERPAKQNTTIADGGINYYANGSGIISNFGVRSSKNKTFWGIRGGINSNKDYTDGNESVVPNSRFNQKTAKLFSGIYTKRGVSTIFYNYNQFKLGLVNRPGIAAAKGNNDRKNDAWYQDLDNHMLTLKNTRFVGRSKYNFDISYQRNNRKLQASDKKKLVEMHLQTITGELKDYISFSDSHQATFSLQGMYQSNKNIDANQHVLPDYSMYSLAAVSIYKYNAEKLNAQAGLRLDYKSIDVPSQALPATTPTAYLDPFDENYFNISASIGATYPVSEKFLLRSNIASAFRTPNLAELTQDGVHATRYEKGNRELKAQRNYEFDLSGHYHADRFVFDISGFYNQIQDYIFLSPTADTTTSGLNIYEYEQTNAVITGFETGVNYLPIDWLDIHGSYSFLLGTQKDGSSLPFIPQNKVDAGVKLTRHGKGALTTTFFSFNGLLASKQQNPAQFETETDGYLLFNSSIGGIIESAFGKIDIQLGVDNLLDTEYNDHLSTIKDLPYYNMGRNIFGKLKFQF